MEKHSGAVPVLLSVTEGREYTVQVGSKTYWYLVDSAHKEYIKYLFVKAPWQALYKLKKLCSEWERR